MDSNTYTLPELGVFVGVVSTAITGTIVAIITAWRTGSKVDKVLDKTEVIHDLTNSNYTEQKVVIKDLLSEVKVLTMQLAEQEKQRAVLAAEVKIQSGRT